MSVLWTLGCWRDRLRGVVGRGQPRRPPSRSYLMPRVRGFRVRTRGLPYEREALAQWELGGHGSTPGSRPGPLPAPGRPMCTRVGIYWSGVVRTARAPDPHGVHPTLVQWHPTLVEWTLGCWRDRLRGVVGRGRPRRPASRSYLMPRVRGFRVRTRGLPYEREALAQWELGGHGSTPGSRPGPLPAPGRPMCTRVGIYWSGVVRTARAPDPHGVHPTLVQWHPTLVEWTLGCWRDRLRGVVGRGRPRRPASRSYLMPRVRGFRVRTRGLPYERDVLTQGRARRPGLNWSSVARAARSPGKPPNRCLRSHDTHLSQKS